MDSIDFPRFRFGPPEDNEPWHKRISWIERTKRRKMQTLWQDVRYGLRMILKRPGYTAIAVLTLALGIGANTAIFSFVNALLLNPLPFPELNRIVAIWDESDRFQHNEVAFANYLDWRSQQSSFEHLGLYRWWGANITGVDPPERIQGFLLSSNMFDVLGVKPALGRGFLPDEDQPGKDGVAILTHGLWQRRFGGDAQAIGRTLTVNGAVRTIIGVMPPDYNFPRGAEILAPLTLTPERMSDREGHAFLAVGRLKPGVSIQTAQADLDAITHRLAEQYPQTNTGLGARIYPLLDDTVRMYRAVLLLLTGAVGFVLLIACANVANLMLARSTGRFKEAAIRAALGASRWRIARLFLTESVMLSVIGGTGGILFGLWGIDLMASFIPSSDIKFIPGWDRIGIDLPVLGFTLGVSIVTGLLFGLAPALQSSKTNLSEGLKEGARQSTSGAVKHRLRSLLVITEVALSLILLVGAGLMLKSFWLLLAAGPGFEHENRLTMGITLSGKKYADEAPIASYFRELEARVKALPGVEAVAAINHIPLGGSNSSSSILIEGVPEPPPGQGFDGRHRVCTPDYFETMGIKLIKGRSFTDADRADTPRVIIISETLEKRFWPKGDSVGKRIRFAGPLNENPWMEIVGVVNDVKHDLNIPYTMDYYLPHQQSPWNSMVLVARTKTEPLSLAGAIRNEALGIDKDQPVFDIKTMRQVRSQSVLTYSISGTWMSIFAVIALILAAVGIYGVMSYSVSQRTHEIGVRMALGARSRDVLMLIVSQGLRLTIIGLTIGLFGAWGLARALQGLLYGVSPTDWVTFAGVFLLLGGMAFLACFIPARRATKVDPMIALRYE
jgi:putative ABC transport system permease protein